MCGPLITASGATTATRGPKGKLLAASMWNGSPHQVELPWARISLSPWSGKGGEIRLEADLPKPYGHP